MEPGGSFAEEGSVAGKTVVALRSSYEPSALSRLITAIYLATLGRDKIGSFMEASDGWHAGHLTGEQHQAAMAEVTR